jgi:hypothetical protein
MGGCDSKHTAVGADEILSSHTNSGRGVIANSQSRLASGGHSENNISSTAKWKAMPQKTTVIQNYQNDGSLPSGVTANDGEIELRQLLDEVCLFSSLLLHLLLLLFIILTLSYHLILNYQSINHHHHYFPSLHCLSLANGTTSYRAVCQKMLHSRIVLLLD